MGAMGIVVPARALVWNIQAGLVCAFAKRFEYSRRCLTFSLATFPIKGLMQMDDAVVRAMARWPNVPDVHGWLSLDKRGQWRLKGGTIGNESLREFISRNYLRMPDGSYVFQNGPQRVYVALQYTPWVLSINGTGVLRLHTGAGTTLTGSAWMDEHGALLLATDVGIALVDDRDLEQLSAEMIAPDGKRMSDDQQIDALELLLGAEHRKLKLRWHGQLIDVDFVASGEVSARFEFNPEPRPVS